MAGAADAPRLPGLEGAEELGLELERELADLVDEERAAVGLFEEARRATCAPVKAPFTKPKSSASRSVGATAPQSKTTNGPPLRGALIVDAAGEELLAGAGFAEQEDGLLGGGGALEPREEGAHRDAGADGLAEAGPARERDQRRGAGAAHRQERAAEPRLGADSGARRRRPAPP